MVSLTFDDGPDPLWTLRVLRELDRSATSATFFMLGARIEAAPRVVQAALAAGADVQLHGHRHLRHDERDEEEIERDTATALAAFARIGVRPLRWRAPWGIVTPATERVAARHGLELVGWTIDTHDWRGDAAGEMLARAKPALTPDAIVLMHDALGPGALRAGAQNTLELIAPLVGAARERGLSVGALASLEHAANADARADRAALVEASG